MLPLDRHAAHSWICIFHRHFVRICIYFIAAWLILNMIPFSGKLHLALMICVYIIVIGEANSWNSLIFFSTDSNSIDSKNLSCLESLVPLSKCLISFSSDETFLFTSSLPAFHDFFNFSFNGFWAFATQHYVLFPLFDNMSISRDVLAYFHLFSRRPSGYEY